MICDKHHDTTDAIRSCPACDADAGVPPHEGKEDGVNEIEQLREENEKLRTALKRISTLHPCPDVACHGCEVEMGWARRDALEALGFTDDALSSLPAGMTHREMEEENATLRARVAELEDSLAAAEAKAKTKEMPTCRTCRYWTRESTLSPWGKCGWWSDPRLLEGWGCRMHKERNQ